MALQDNDVLYAERMGIPGSVSGEDIRAAGSAIWFESFEENGSINTTTNGGDHWAVGNGAELTGDNGVCVPIACKIMAISGTRNSGSFTIEVIRNNAVTGVTLAVNAVGVFDLLTTPIDLQAGDIVRPRTIAVAGATIGTVTFMFGVPDAIPTGTSIGALSDVDLTGLADGDALVWNATTMRFEPGASGGADAALVSSVAAGFTSGLEQQLLAADGQVGKTILAVGHTFYQGNAAPSADHKAQITSLGDGNVVFVYATGADFTAGTVQEGPVFLSKGEVYVIENCQNGTIITATEGAYGFSQQRSGNNESPMPLLSLALSFTDTFFFAFRDSNSNEGRVWIVNGPVASEITMFDAGGSVVTGQQDITLDPWQWLEMNTNGNGEYRIVATNAVMACVAANMDALQFYDSRLILPLTNDAITWPRQGNFSAPYANTLVNYYVNDGAEGTFTVSPGSPVDFGGGAGTSASDQDYEPRGATRVLINGLGTAYSGADSSGLEATPMCPVSTFTQRIALPLHIRNSGDGGNNGIALASPFVGRARLYEWNQGTGQADLVTVNNELGVPVTEILIQRRNGDTELGDAALPADQLHPASALISAQGGGGTDPNSYDLLGDFNGGYIEIDVPCTCVFNSEQNENGGSDHTFRGTSGAAVVGIHADDDEQLTYGITPEFIRAEIREGEDGRLFKRTINNLGVETWVVA